MLESGGGGVGCARWAGNGARKREKEIQGRGTQRVEGGSGPVCRNGEGVGVQCAVCKGWTEVQGAWKGGCQVQGGVTEIRLVLVFG